MSKKRDNMNIALKSLQIKARHQVYTLLSGHNLSKLHGEGYDFSELREYQMGDDIRKINWTITAKLGKPYVKELHANRELSVVVAALMDGSLYFGTSNAKQKKLTELASILAYATQLSGDIFRGISYEEHKVFATMPTKQIYHIEQFSKHLFEASLLGTKISLNTSVADLFKRVEKPSLIFIIGDFLEEIDLSLLAQKHEIIALIVRDRDEENLKSLGEVTLENPRGKAKLNTYFGKRSIEKYKAKLIENDLKLKEHFTAFDIRSVKIFTDEEVLPKLSTLFI
jgi:uncharacterized protein (DUF58 family)